MVYAQRRHDAMHLELLIRGRQVIEVVEGEGDMFEAGAGPRGCLEAFEVDDADAVVFFVVGYECNLVVLELAVRAEEGL